MSASPIASDALPRYPVRTFTVDEYHRLGEAGILTDEDRVELLEGLIVLKMIHHPPHDTAVKLTDEALRPLLPPIWHTRVQSAITTADSEPEPDIAVVQGAIRDFATRHPGPAEIGLIVEVAESSLQRDRQKRRLYARAEIPCYWIVNLTDRCLETYHDPVGQGQDADYARVVRYGPNQNIPFVLARQHLGDVRSADCLP